MCFEEITKLINEESPVHIIYLDFKTAFEKVPHQRLLFKLNAHGIDDGIIDRTEQWLTDRRQRVGDGEVSNWKSLLSEVPQESVLGPLLCLIYNNMTMHVLKCVDDTNAFIKDNNDGDKQHLQNYLHKLLNFGICKCLLHTGHGKFDINNNMGNTVLGTIEKKRI